MQKLLFAGLLIPAMATGEPVPLGEAIEDIERMEISISGYIGYDANSLSDYKFAFYTRERNGFRVVMDAGRATRKQVQEQCAKDLNFIMDLGSLCEIDATGILTVEGGLIVISVDDVQSIKP